MSLFVLDASVTLAWFFEDEASAYSAAVLESLRSHQAQVPGIWPLEVVNVLLVGERRGRCSEARSSRFLGLLSALPIQVTGVADLSMPVDLLSLARRHGLSAYDADYLRLSIRGGIPMATQDKKLVNAASECGVGLWLI
ncbi:type II toxin-antitoxin system VapC family toxin [Acidiferrobacter sp.]|uniref:type II toxin-antitoxin system VapC family toxin n=1 Tax=Acidiferrobacter sp. TaxID=1872107 RepID=UPI0026078E6F|nr:type II toxin-antitoxin system VapC family toxin [Acidiferrobacter sp.]